MAISLQTWLVGPTHVSSTPRVSTIRESPKFTSDLFISFPLWPGSPPAMELCSASLVRHLGAYLRHTLFPAPRPSSKPSSAFPGQQALSSSLAEGMLGREKAWIPEITWGSSPKPWHFTTFVSVWPDEPLGRGNSPSRGQVPPVQPRQPPPSL